MRCAGLLFVLAVLHEQSSHRRAQRGLALLQRKLDLLARLFFLACTGQRENAIDGIPELSQRCREKCALLRSPAGRSKPASRRMASSRSVRMRWNWADHAVRG